MNMKQKKQEPDQLHVELIDWKGQHVELVNDGSITTRICDDGGENRTILQTRAAFRGFVGSLTGLFNYRLDIAYGTWIDEDGFGHYEEEGDGE